MPDDEKNFHVSNMVLSLKIHPLIIHPLIIHPSHNFMQRPCNSLRHLSRQLLIVSFNFVQTSLIIPPTFLSHKTPRNYIWYDTLLNKNQNLVVPI